VITRLPAFSAMKPIATTVGRESEAQQMFSKRKVRIPDPTQSA